MRWEHCKVKGHPLYSGELETRYAHLKYTHTNVTHKRKPGQIVNSTKTLQVRLPTFDDRLDKALGRMHAKARRLLESLKESTARHGFKSGPCDSLVFLPFFAAGSAALLVCFSARFLALFSLKRSPSSWKRSR